jgi:tRNA U34 5-carboxymethylaminomethyl modifying GTPase MnmE/TrmE
MSTKNIVLFGQTGAGKSSLVNLMAGEDKAETSGDSFRCTLKWKEYPIAFDGYDYKVFDTIGLEEPSLGIEEYLDAILNARSLIKKLEHEGGIDLLLFCVRAGRFTSTIRSNYRLFYEWLCEKKFPIVLVITGLERETNMEDWWDRHGDSFEKSKIFVDGHACITAASNMDGRHQELYQVSRRVVRDLVKEHTHHMQGAWKGYERCKEGDGVNGGEKWFGRFRRQLSEVLQSDHAQKKVIVAILIKRNVPREDAQHLASQIVQDLADRKSAI